MPADSKRPRDLSLVVHHGHSEGYERSDVLLAKASAEGRLHLLTRGWERALGYLPAELNHKTLMQLTEFDARGAAAAVDAILDERDLRPLSLSLRCGNGLAKGFRLYRHYDRQMHTMYILAEETRETPAALMREEERRLSDRRCRG
jgi:hypothetical protein